MLNNGKSALIIVFACIPLMLLSQEMNKKIHDSKLDKEILYGDCNRAGLELGEFGKMFNEYYRDYEPDRAVLNQLKLKKEGIDILIVLGTWCSDSQEQVPRFLKILDKIRFDKNEVQMICVSREKEAGEIDVKLYNIEKVPTFIVYRKGREIGRIIETPYMTLEKDLLMFFSDK
jgi:hypothetical protein